MQDNWEINIDQLDIITDHLSTLLKMVENIKLAMIVEHVTGAIVLIEV